MSEHIVATHEGRIGRILIDRPRALNALDGPMFAAIGATLERWRDDPAVEAIVVRGAGSSFSAGGDIRFVRDLALAADERAIATMYSHEYRLNAQIAAYPKPYVAAVDGYCMGGGLGVAMYGTFRAVTERAQLAMPEVGIGFFPDVGASYVLPRLPGRIGWYMGLTGARIGASDALACGLATHQLDDATFARIEAIVNEDPAREAIAQRLAAIAVAPGPPTLQPVLAQIERCFDQPSLQAVMAALERDAASERGTASEHDAGTWASVTLAAMRRTSPTSLAITFELFRRGSMMLLSECLETEYQLAVRVCRTPEFLEGVRAMVIDKDRTPQWNPPRIEDLDPSALAALWSKIDVTRNELRLASAA